MKKFYILFAKELKEMLTPQLWIPFFAVIVVFFIIGNVTSKQMQEQTNKKEKITVADLDQSTLSTQSIQAINSTVEVIKTSATTDTELISAMKKNHTSVGIIFPEGFALDISKNGKTNLQSYAILDNFSVLATKKLATSSTCVGIVNNFVSDYIINNKLKTLNTDIKNPIVPASYVSANGKISQGDATQVLGYILSQTTTIPVALFVVVIMASQMIATAIATEKENKTLETLLSLPVPRKYIVTSKMLSAGLVSLFMATIYMFAIRKFNSGISSTMSPGVNPANDIATISQNIGLKLNTFGYLELGMILFLAILLGLAIATILGAFAEDAKSAQIIVAPLMILVMIPYFITLFTDINTLSPIVRWIIYTIPFSHMFLAIPNILLGKNWMVFTGVAYLLILFIVFVFTATRIFSSDKILTIKFSSARKKQV